MTTAPIATDPIATRPIATAPIATAPIATAPIVLLDVDDLAEADLEADLAERLELDGWVFPRPEVVVSVVRDVLRGGAAAVAAHDLGPGAAELAG